MRYSGRIGFKITAPREPGSDIYVPTIVWKKYKGNVPRTMSKWVDSTAGANDNIDMSNTISIVADAFLSHNYCSIFAVEFAGEFWDVKNIQINPPRLEMTIGGVYTGDEPTP